MELNDELKKMVRFKCRASSYSEALNSMIEDILIKNDSKVEEALAFPNLKRVIVSISDPITSVDVENLFKLEKLESMQLSRCHIRFEEMPKSLKVKNIYLDGCDVAGTLKLGNQPIIENFLIYKMSVDTLDLTGLTNLKRLTIANSSVKNIIGLDKKNLTSIKEIILDGTRFENEPEIDFSDEVHVSRKDRYLLFDRLPVSGNKK